MQGGELDLEAGVRWVGEGGGEMRTQQAAWGEVDEGSVQWQNMFPLAGVMGTRRRAQTAQVGRWAH